MRLVTTLLYPDNDDSHYIIERRLYFEDFYDIMELRKKTNWIKDEKGRFAGSTPMGGSGSGGNTLTNGDNGGIINTKGVKSLEQAKKRDHKIYITDVAIDKVGQVELSDFSDAQTENMQKKHKELMKIAKEKNNSNEVLLINDLDFKSEVSIFGGEFKVSPNDNPFAVSVIRGAERQSLIYMHNHPSTNIFSVGDIDTFICEGAIKTMSVVTNQGEVYVLNKIADYSYAKAKSLLKSVFDSFPDGEIDDKQFVSEFLKHCGKGGIEYAKSK